MASLASVVDHKDPSNYGSKQALVLMIKAGFTGRDSEDNIIEPSGSGRNKGNF